MADPTTWKDVGLELVKQLPPTVVAFGSLVWAFRRYVKPAIEAIDKKQDAALANQKRIEEKADGQHSKALEEIKKAGKYEGAQEAKQEAIWTEEQVHKVVEQVMAAQSKVRGRRRSDG